MQSIFSPAARRDPLQVRANSDRRDGELKMDWTKPLHRTRPMGVEWLAELSAKAESGAAEAEFPGFRMGSDGFDGKSWTARMLARQIEIRCGGGQSFAGELARPSS